MGIIGEKVRDKMDHVDHTECLRHPCSERQGPGTFDGER